MRIRSLLAALLAALALAAAAPAPAALALSCADRTPQEQFAAAESVATATVIKAANPRANALQPVVLVVDQVYKGEVGQRIVIMHNAMVGPDIHLDQGKRYLLFTRRAPDASRRTSLCDGTRLVTGDLPPEYTAALGAGHPPTGVSDPAPEKYGETQPAPVQSLWLFRTLAIGIPLALVALLFLLRRRRRP